MATKKATTTKKATAPKKTTAKKAVTKKTTASKAVKKTAPKKAAPKKTVAKKAVVKKNSVKSLRLANDESQAFLLISSDFDGQTRKALQFFCSIVLLGMLATMIYMAVLANDIAQSILKASIIF